MEPMEILKHEHRVIEKVLAAMEVMVDRAEHGGPVPPGFFLEAADFIAGFADGCHHKKEEDVLFAALESKGYSREAGPVAMLLAQHEDGRRYVRAMKEAVQQWQAGDERARQGVIDSARNYISLLHDHIGKEDNVLFPMAVQTLSAAELSDIARAFERIEEQETGAGAHEQYSRLAQSLAEQAQTRQG